MSQSKSIIPSVNDALLLHKKAYQDYINKYGETSKNVIDDVNKNFLLVNIKRLILCKMIFEKKEKKDLNNISMYVKKFDEITIQYLDILGDSLILNLIKEEVYLSSCKNAKLIKSKIDDILII